MPPTMVGHMTLKFVPLLRATILVTGYALPAEGLFLMRGAVNTAAGMYV